MEAPVANVQAHANTFDPFAKHDALLTAHHRGHGASTFAVGVGILNDPSLTATDDTSAYVWNLLGLAAARGIVPALHAQAMLLSSSNSTDKIAAFHQFILRAANEPAADVGGLVGHAWGEMQRLMLEQATGTPHAAGPAAALFKANVEALTAGAVQSAHVDARHSHDLLAALERDRANTGDMVFSLRDVVGDVRAHKDVMAVASVRLRTIVAARRGTAGPVLIYFATATELEKMRRVIQFVYTGKLHLKHGDEKLNDILHLLHTAQYLDVAGMLDVLAAECDALVGGLTCAAIAMACNHPRLDALRNASLLCFIANGEYAVRSPTFGALPAEFLRSAVVAGAHAATTVSATTVAINSLNVVLSWTAVADSERRISKHFVELLAAIDLHLLPADVCKVAAAHPCFFVAPYARIMLPPFEAENA
jgi:hypothetical protein